MFQNLRYAIRSLLKTPWLTAVVIITLALGIAANTAVFSWTRSVLLHPLRGVSDGQRLVALEMLYHGERHQRVVSGFPGLSGFITFLFRCDRILVWAFESRE